jgi:hypothetical protein
MIGRGNGTLLAALLFGTAACIATPTSAPSASITAPSGTPRAAVTPTCDAPPTIVFDHGTPIPIVLKCDKALSAATAALPAAMAGRDGGNVASIEFGYGQYCPPALPCAFAGQGDLGFVVFGFTDGSSWLVSLKADQKGEVSVTGSGPPPTNPYGEGLRGTSDVT